MELVIGRLRQDEGSGKYQRILVEVIGEDVVLSNMYY